MYEHPDRVRKMHVEKEAIMSESGRCILGRRRLCSCF